MHPIIIPEVYQVAISNFPLTTRMDVMSQLLDFSPNVGPCFGGGRTLDSGVRKIPTRHPVGPERNGRHCCPSQFDERGFILLTDMPYAQASLFGGKGDHLPVHMVSFLPS